MIHTIHWPLTLLLCAFIAAGVFVLSIGGLLLFSIIDLVARSRAWRIMLAWSRRGA